ncbi:MAG TPA: sucrase ferredoxin [Actinomycetota bacterium]|nr:sucrase ferredoxin [Actinomycetota bacterium]
MQPEPLVGAEPLVQAEAFRCADSAEARDEPLYGTASFVRRWLLVEQPGAWGANALLESRMPRAVATELHKSAGAVGARVILLRRGARMSQDRRHVYFLRTERGRMYKAELSLDKIDDLLDIDLSPLRKGGEIPEATTNEEPLFLVCTHGRHDACCSIRGNLVSRIACAQEGYDTWECSHIGGDRFAANVVCFPHGIYYGRVGPRGILSVMHAYRNGRLSLDHFRGRCSNSFPVQAAEYFLRRQTGMDMIDGPALQRVTGGAEGVSTLFALADGRHAEVVVRVSSGEKHRLTCNSSGPASIPLYELVSCSLSSA